MLNRLELVGNMEELLNNTYLSALVVLVSQIVFIYLRTLNVIYTSELRVKAAIISGAGIGLAWLVSLAIGFESVKRGELLPIFTYLLGGGLGTYWGIRKEKIKHKYGHKNESDSSISDEEE